MSKRKHEDDAVQTDTSSNTQVFRSAPLEDRQSTFIGIFSPTLKPKDLQSLAEIESASHKVLGWRRESNQQSITKAKQYVTGSDDDGEKYGGKRIEKVLESSQAIGSCVVARWYGGVMLGPVRFTHMEDTAREAIRQWQDHEAESRSKKRRLEEEGIEHTKLSKSLRERDQSVVVLRSLAAEKENRLKQVKEDVEPATSTDEAVSQSEPPKSSAAPTIDYSKMPLDRLRALDKARDATLSFLLKRIDKAEVDLKSRQNPANEPP